MADDNYIAGSSMVKPQVKEAYNPNVDPAEATPLGAQVQGLNWSIKNNAGDRVTHVGNADTETDEYLSGRTLFINKAVQQDPTILETLEASWETENTIGSIFNEIDTQNNYIQEGYDSVDDPQLEPYLNDPDMLFRASLSFNPQNTSDVIANTLRERENRQIQSDAGGMGMALTMAVAILDPVYIPMYIFPAAQAARMGRTGFLVADAAVGTAAAETVLHSTQQLRTAEETAFNMTAAVLMSYGLGKAIDFIDGKQIQKLANDQVAMTKASEVQGAKLDMTPEQVAAGNVAEARSVGAMAVDDPMRGIDPDVLPLRPDDYLPVGADNLVMEKLIKSSMAPNAQMSMSPSLQTRKYNALWGQQSILYKGNMEGRGIAANGGAIESRIAAHHGAAQIVAESVEDSFWAYKGMERAGVLAKAKSSVGDITGVGKAPDAMSLDEFNKAVFWTLDSNVDHGVPEVNKAAKQVREYFTDMEKEGVKVGLLDPDRLPDENRYLSRKWKHDEIVRKEPEVRKKFNDFFLMRRNAIRDKLGKSSRLEDIENKIAAATDKAEQRALIDEHSRILTESGGFKEADDLLVAKEKLQATEADLNKKIAGIEGEKIEAKSALNNETQLYDDAINTIDKKIKKATLDAQAVPDRKSALYKKKRDKVREYQAAKQEIKSDNLTSGLRNKIADINKRIEENKKARVGVRKQIREATEKLDEAMESIRPVLPFMKKSSSELDDLSRETIQNITGSASGMNTNVLPEGIVIRVGAFKERSLDIPNSWIKDLDVIEDNVTQVIRGYTKSVSPQIEVARSFDGDIQAQKMFNDINENWNELDDAMKRVADKENWSPERISKENVKQAKARKNDIDNARTVRDRVMGSHDANFDAQSVGNRFIRGLKQTAFLSKLGGMTISAIPDLSRAVSTYGFTPVLKMMKSLATDPNVRMMTNMENKRAGVVLETFINQRMNRIADLTEDVMGSSKFEKAMGYAADNYGKVTGMTYWNNGLKNFAGIMAQDSIMRSINKVAKGQKLTKLEARVLGQTGLNPAMQNRISKQLKHAEEAEGVWVAKTNEWTDEEAVRSFRSALKQMSDHVIVTPGAGDIPKFIGHGTSSLIFQFKSFILTSHQKMLISGLQQHDQAMLSGLLMSGALGAAVHGIKTYQATGEPPQVDNPGDFIFESLDRTGYFGYFGEFMQMAPKLTGGRLNVNKLWGGEQQTYNRYAARDLMGTLLGPSLGTVSEGLRAARALGSGEVSEGDIKAMRRNFWYQNHFMFRELFDVMQDQAVDKFATE